MWAMPGPTTPEGLPISPPAVDPRGRLKVTEESDEEMGDAPAEEAVPVGDWVNNLNKFRTVGKDYLAIKSKDLDGRHPVERLMLSSWRGLVYDMASTFDAIINPRLFEGAMRQLRPEHTEELMPYIDSMYMALGQPRGSRELECEQLYGLCTNYQGGKHPVAPPVYDIPTVRLYLVGDSTMFTTSKNCLLYTSDAADE